ncbi:hypothetical protein [Nocardiopsis listeri]|uniref:hypothetical protein n=1 Tax=Nocardiopsis listeri TaxID=53440 RepID=UPI000834974F|nr:hypothetical protein [Nocardiopsis listeri]
MSMSQRIAGGLAIGAAALALPLAASPAHAADWEVVGGGFDMQAVCLIDAYSYVVEEDNNHDFTEYKCVYNGSTWDVWVR